MLSGHRGPNIRVLFFPFLPLLPFNSLVKRVALHGHSLARSFPSLDELPLRHIRFKEIRTKGRRGVDPFAAIVRDRGSSVPVAESQRLSRSRAINKSIRRLRRLLDECPFARQHRNSSTGSPRILSNLDARFRRSTRVSFARRCFLRKRFPSRVIVLRQTRIRDFVSCIPAAHAYSA